MKEISGARRQFLAAAVAAAVVAGLYLAAADAEFHFMEGASATKLLQVRALLSGRGYTDIGRIGSPPEVVRPPGFALVLAAAVSVFGEDMWALKALNNLFAPAGCLVLFFFLRRQTKDPWLAAALSLASYLLPHLFRLSRYLESEFLFCLLWYSGLAVFERARARVFSERGLLAGFCLLLAASCLVRTAGLVLAPASLLALAASKEAPSRTRWFWAAAIAGAWLAVGGGWMVRTQAVAAPGDLTYLDKVLVGEPVTSVWWLAEDQRVPLLPAPRRATVVEIIERAIPNSGFFLRQGLENVWPASAGWPVAVVLAAALLPAGAILAGLVLGLWRKRRLMDFLVALYLPMLLFYPYQDPRFLLPIVPLLLLYLVEALAVVPGLNPGQGRRIYRVAGISLCGVLAIIFFFHDLGWLLRPGSGMPVLSRGPRFRITSPHPGAYHSLLLLEWLREHSEPGDRILYHSYPPCGLVTGRECTSIPMVEPSRLVRYLDEAGVKWVVVDDEADFGGGYTAAFTRWYLVPAVESYPGRFATAYGLEGSRARVLRVLPPAGARAQPSRPGAGEEAVRSEK